MELRNTQFFRWHLGYCFCQVKRPNYYYKRNNRHDKCPRRFGVGVLMFVWVLGRTFLTMSKYPRFSFLVKRLLSERQRHFIV